MRPPHYLEFACEFVPLESRILGGCAGFHSMRSSFACDPAYARGMFFTVVIHHLVWSYDAGRNSGAVEAARIFGQLPRIPPNIGRARATLGTILTGIGPNPTKGRIRPNPATFGRARANFGLLRAFLTQTPSTRHRLQPIYGPARSGVGQGPISAGCGRRSADLGQARRGIGTSWPGFDR